MTEFPSLEASLLRAARRRYGWRRWRPRVAVAVAAAALAGVVLLVARPATPDVERQAAPGWTTTNVPRYGLSISLPDGWRLAPRSLTPYLGDPREIASATTFAPGTPVERCAMFPVAALERLTPTDALVSVQERGAGSPALAPRPARFQPAAQTDSARIAATCLGRPVAGTLTYTSFSDGPRNLAVLMVVGSSASARVRGQAVAIVDRMRFSPTFVPSWPFSG
jgi:hypothetical protein